MGWWSARNSSIQSHHLPPALQTSEPSETVTKVSLAGRVASYEKELIQDALKTTGGNRARAAKLLNTTERILGYRINHRLRSPAALAFIFSSSSCLRVLAVDFCL